MMDTYVRPGYCGVLCLVSMSIIGLAKFKKMVI